MKSTASSGRASAASSHEQSRTIGASSASRSRSRQISGVSSGPSDGPAEVRCYQPLKRYGLPFLYWNLMLQVRA
jgi:hypothetical protein